jgi:argininosuccinate lyase
MPNKRNPDVLELIRGKAARVQADAAQAFMIAQGRISGYHRDHQELKPSFMDGLSKVSDCVKIMTPLIEGTNVNESQLRAAMTSELFAVDEMIDQIKSGVPMREAYRQVKVNLNELKSPNVDAALKARSHLGGAGNLGLDGLKDQIKHSRDKWMIRQEKFEKKLMGLVST